MIGRCDIAAQLLPNDGPCPNYQDVVLHRSALRHRSPPDVRIPLVLSLRATSDPMITPPEVITTSELPTAVIQLLIPGRDMPKYMDPAIQEILKTLADQGMRPAGPMFSYHHRRPSDTFDFEIGFPVSAPIEPVGRVINSKLPAVKVARSVYQGPYEGLAQAWPALQKWVRENGHGGTGRFWERYLNNPVEVKNPSEYRTELNWVIGDRSDRLLQVSTNEQPIMPQQIFINMHVKDLTRSKVFFDKLGYTFDPRFTDENAACMIISDTIYCMLLTTGHMERSVPKGKTIADTTKVTETLLALSAESKDAVNALFDKAIAAGGTECRPAEDHGFMYGRSFNDLDGHIWELFWFDPNAIQPQS